MESPCRVTLYSEGIEGQCESESAIKTREGENKTGNRDERSDERDQI